MRQHLLVFFVAALLGGLGWYLATPHGSLLGESLPDLARACPDDCQLFLALDARKSLDLSQAVAFFRRLEEKNAELKSSVDPLEKGWGLQLEDLARWAKPAGCVALFPPEGHQSLLNRTDRHEFLVVVALADPAQAEAWLVQQLDKHWSASVSNGLHVSKNGFHAWTIERGALLIGSGADAVSRGLLAARGKAPSLAQNQLFREALGKCPVDQGLAFYGAGAALSRLDENERYKHRADGQTMGALRSLRYLMATAARTEKGLALDGFLGLDPKSESAWARAALAQPKDAPLRLGSRIPAAWGNFTAVNVTYAYHLLYQTLLLDPGMRMQLAALPMGLRVQLGISVEDVLKCFSGEAVWSEQSDDLIVAVGLADRKALDKMLSIFATKGGLRLLPLEKLGSVQLIAPAAESPLRLAILDDAVLVGVGTPPAEAVRTSLDVKQPITGDPILQEALKAAGSHWVVVWYARAQQLAAVVRVESGGLRLASFGGGAPVLEKAADRLAELVVPRIVEARRGSLLTGCEQNLTSLAERLEAYKAKHDGNYPETLAELPGGVPSCPSAGKDTYSETYWARGESFTVFCKGQNHEGLPADSPEYNTSEGLIEY